MFDERTGEWRNGPIETMKELAEEAAGPDLDWIPKQFRRDTIEETARFLLENQKNEQRKITELATRNRELESFFATFDQPAEEASYELEPPDEYEPHATAPVDSRPLLAAAQPLVQQAVQQALAAAAPPQPTQSYIAPDHMASLRRTMKLQAQTADGVTGRPPRMDDSAVRWSEIANADTGKLGL